MKVYLCGHYHCEECRRHCTETLMPPRPGGDPGYGFNAFWCENPACPNYQRTFVMRARLIEVDEVPLNVAELVH